MENEFELKPFDKVLVRDKKTDAWRIDLYEKRIESFSDRTYSCLVSTWVYCIPYEGNEHLMDTANMPEITDLKNGILFGIELKVGYVLEFDNFSHDKAVVIPTTTGLAISYLDDGWDYLVDICPDRVNKIRGIIDKRSFKGGELLWHKQ